MNDGLLGDLCSLTYASVDKAVELILHLGQGTQLVKMYLKDAYRSLLLLLSMASKPHHYIRLNSIVRADLQWWHCFLQHWNGSSFFPLLTPSIHIYSDASGSFGCGAFGPTMESFQLQWPTHWSLIDMAIKELVPIVVAAALWGSSWEGHHIRFHSDNIAVVPILTKHDKRPSLESLFALPLPVPRLLQV